MYFFLPNSQKKGNISLHQQTRLFIKGAIMLKLVNIEKIYKSGELQTHALKNINLEFRQSEFVSILGPSGCGKTTLLNIIGGLDRYTSGDLVIDGISTKQYKDKNWDAYRNESIGFVFQSYNLIPHQTILENVEIALTLSGVSREERRRRATEVLKSVGLEDKLNNKPSQLSGGQMQRVAIARALVNNPKIILADEPTGALDTQSSLQIMEILKEISKDRLIIMVTHNPDLANQYSTRIVNLLDGSVTNDSNPYTQTDNSVQKEKPNKSHKRRMSFFTALSLSFKNLLTKKARTLLVTFAGSIGIIGIALILAISSGFTTYINKQQQNTLSNYPITIEAKSIDFYSVMMAMFMPTETEGSSSHNSEGVYPKDRISSILENIGENAMPNNLEAFYEYIEENREEKLDPYVTAIKYSYDVGLEFFHKADSYSVEQNVQPNSTSLYKIIMMYCVEFFTNKAQVVVSTDIPEGQTLQGYYVHYVENQTIENVVNQYLGGLDRFSGINVYEKMRTDGFIYLSQTDIESVVNALLGGLIRIGSYRTTNVNAFDEMIDNQKIIDEQYEIVYGEKTNNSNDAYLVLDNNNEIDDYVLYALGFINDEQMKSVLRAKVKEETIPNIYTDYENIVGKEYKVLTNADYYTFDSDLGTYIDLRMYADYTSGYYDLTKYPTALIDAYNACTNTIKIAGILRPKTGVEVNWLTTGVVYKKAYTQDMMTYYNQKIDNINASGGIVGGQNAPKLYEHSPKKIEIYVSSFEAKDIIKSFVKEYNANAHEGDEISYSDTVGTIMSAVSTIITAITYVLIAFVSVSLVVSSIMIAVITYISVIERTKEIGILRSVGASKKDVSRVFTAESFIIGLSSGALGIIVSLLLTIPINIILYQFTSLSSLAYLPLMGALTLIGISILLTLIAGFFPSKSAAKKDPVVALREN